jgi:hypothetical protein
VRETAIQLRGFLIHNLMALRDLEGSDLVRQPRRLIGGRGPCVADDRQWEALNEIALISWTLQKSRYRTPKPILLKRNRGLTHEPSLM